MEIWRIIKNNSCLGYFLDCFCLATYSLFSDCEAFDYNLYITILRIITKLPVYIFEYVFCLLLLYCWFFFITILLKLLSFCSKLVCSFFKLLFFSFDFCIHNTLDLFHNFLTLQIHLSKTKVTAIETWHFRFPICRGYEELRLCSEWTHIFHVELVRLLPRACKTLLC